jgi:phosphatidylinositol alpha-1,6-mannosyltransferase
MPLGKTVGFPGCGSLNAGVVTEPSLRVLALVTDAFGGLGGIAQYNRDLFSSLTACDGISDIIILPRLGTASYGQLPPRIRQLGPVPHRGAYLLAALQASQAHRPIHVVFCGHLFMVPLAACLAKLIGARLWVQVHGIDAWQELSFLHRRAVETAALVTSVSRYTRQRLLEWVGIDPARVKVLPNTVDPSFRPGPKPDYLLDRHGARGKKVLMTVSRLAASEHYKGHDRVIRSLSRIRVNHPEAIYIIVGDGDDRPRLEALAEEVRVQEQVHFAGPVPAKELPDYYRLADLLVMPSTGEGFGIVFLEAMASGVDVIGGNSDGSVDALCDGVLGTLVDPDNCEELASAISAGLERPARNRDSDRVDRFKLDLFAGHLHALLHFSLVSPRKTIELIPTHGSRFDFELLRDSR